MLVRKLDRNYEVMKQTQLMMLKFMQRVGNSGASNALHDVCEEVGMPLQSMEAFDAAERKLKDKKLYSALVSCTVYEALLL